MACSLGAARPQARQDRMPTLSPMLEDILPRVVSIAVKGHVAQAENPLPEGALATDVTAGSAAEAAGDLSSNATAFSQFPLLRGIQIDASDTVAEIGEGVRVTAVDPDSPAARAGLQANDFIVRANRRPVADADDLAAAARLDCERLVMQIRRGGSVHFIVVS